MFMMKLTLLWLALVLTCCEAYKVLVVFPMPGKSHSILGHAYVKHLLNDGHEVTYITAIPYKTAHPKLRSVDVSANFGYLPESLMNIKTIMNNEVNIKDFIGMIPLMVGLTRNTFENENVQKLLNDPKEEFDVVIAEWMFGSLPSAIATVYNCPLIWSSSVDVHWEVLRLMGQVANPSYTSNVMSANLPPFNILQRASELWNQIMMLTLRYTYIDRVETQDYEDLIAPIVRSRGRVAPSFFEVQFNASLMLTNSHVSLGQAIAIPQSIKAIGGYHIETELEPLPKDLQTLMDNTKNGVIYFSMGSNLKSKDIPQELKEDLLKMFGELKQTVLWKFEEDMPNKPKNVHILKWAPQPAILSHPKTLLFITHGGLLSTTETIHYGVPIIGIPVFADQFVNVARSVRKGYAKEVTLSMTMTGELKLAIEEIISNPKYAQVAKELSLIYHDRPVSPSQELVHWVKHVVKTRGAPHLRTPAMDVPFYQMLYLDLFAVILVILYLSVKLFKKVCRAVCSKICSDKRKKD